MTETDPTPPSWRHFRIVPKGRRFSVVTFYVRMPINEGDLKALLLAGQKTDSLKLSEALIIGEKLEKAVQLQENQGKRKA